MRRPFLLIILSSCFSIILGQSDVKYLFAQVDTSDQFEYPFTYGNLNLIPDEKFEKAEFKVEDYQSADSLFLANLMNELKQLPKEKQNIVFFIHGLMGHHNGYLSLVANTLDENLYTLDENKYGMVVYLIWRAGLNYVSNLTQTVKIGEEYARLMQDVQSNLTDENLSVDISIMCHSMGNRVFQGIFNEYVKSDLSSPPFKDVILVAADLETDIFYPGQPMENVDAMGDDIHVYFHEYDRTLMMSQLLNQTDRMGLQGITSVDSIPDNVYVIDASYLDDQESLPGKYSNHRYFFTSPTVRQDLFNLLHDSTGQPLPFRKKLDFPNQFALISELKN